MLSNITSKGAACSQLYIYEQLQGVAQTHLRTAVPITVFVSIADVSIETTKYPVIFIENIVFSVINALGACFFKNCNFLDAYQNIKTAAIMLHKPPVKIIILPFNLIKTILNNLSDVKNASSCNEKSNEQAKALIIVYDSYIHKNLKKIADEPPYFAKELAPDIAKELAPDDIAKDLASDINQAQCLCRASQETIKSSSSLSDIPLEKPLLRNARDNVCNAVEKLLTKKGSIEKISSFYRNCLNTYIEA